MKKTNIRHWFFALLACASLFSFIFINTVNVPQTGAVPELELEVDIDEPQDSNQSEVTLPDVQVIKKIIQQGKKILPVS